MSASNLSVSQRRKLRLRKVLMDSHAVTTTEFVKRIFSLGHQTAYDVSVPSTVTIDYNILTNDLVKNGYGDIREFAEDVIDMLNLFCDDDDQISIKKCELEVNLKSILEEFV